MAVVPAAQNFVASNVSGTLAAGASSVTLVDATRFPAAGAGNYAVIWNVTDYPDGPPSGAPSPNGVEIVKYTNIAGNVLTITRGQDGTSDIAHTDSSKTYRCMWAITKAYLDEINNHLVGQASVNLAHTGGNIAVGRADTTIASTAHALAAEKDGGVPLGINRASDSGAVCTFARANTKIGEILVDTTILKVIAGSSKSLELGANGAKKMTIGTDGNVTVDNNLTVSTNLAVTGTTIATGVVTNNSTTSLNGNTTLQTASTPTLTINDTGANAPTISLKDNGTAIGTISADASDLKVFGASSKKLTLGANAVANVVTLTNGASANSIFVDGSSNVGIGDATPSAKLDVAGDVNVQGSVTVDGDPSANLECSTKQYVDNKILSGHDHDGTDSAKILALNVQSKDTDGSANAEDGEVYTADGSGGFELSNTTKIKNGFLTLEAGADLVPSSNAITVTASHHFIDTTSGYSTGTEPVKTISGGHTGAVVVFFAKDNHVQLVNSTTGGENIQIAGSIETIDFGNYESVTMMYDGTWWREIGAHPSTT